VIDRRDHDEIEALLALRALGGAEPSDERRLESEMSSHGASCADCARLAAESAEAAGRLAFAVEPIEPPSGFEDRVVASLGHPRVRARRRWPSVRALAAAAAVAILAFAAGWLVRPQAGGSLEVAPMKGSNGRVAVAYRAGAEGIVLFGSGLGAPPSGRVYELWLIRDGTPIRQGCFAPSGTAGPILIVGQETVRASDVAAVTVESTACPNAPTTKPIMSATLS
jgi:anti-sigma-K factor RskA